MKLWKNKIKQLEYENKELRSVADSKESLSKEYNKIANKYAAMYNSAEIFKNKYLALNNAIKHLTVANDHTLFSKD